MENSFNLRDYDITVAEIHRNLPPSQLYEHAIRYEKDASIAENGALVAYSGVKTGRSPKDKRIVKHPDSEADVWWGPVNIPLDAHSFAINRERARDYLNTRDRLYCFDGFAGWDPKYRIKVRVICSRPYHALFMHTMLIRPTKQELEAFGKPDFVICNAGAFPANRFTAGIDSKTSICLSLEDRELIILGTEYAGEMKKGVFTVANYFAPKRGLLSMHCSATADRQSGRSSLLFGLSGTGKTTLSADPKRDLIGDDEHVWSDDGIFNIEGGCYAKAINLSPETEPDIFQALRFGAVLENVVLEDDRTVDFTDTSITENTRGAYPIHFIRNARIPCMAGHPTDVIFLTCDAFGVLPPVSSLSPGPGDVPLHQRLHGQGRRHRSGGEGAVGHFLAVFRRPVPGVASEQVCRTAGGENETAQRPRLADQHRLERRRARRRQADQTRPHPGHPRRDPQRGACRRQDQTRPRVRFRRGHRLSRRAVRNPVAARHLGGQGGLRRAGQEARPVVHRQLQEIRERRRAGSAGGVHRRYERTNS